MNTRKHIQVIQQKLEKLRSYGFRYTGFSARPVEKFDYALGPTLSLDEVKLFEQTHQITFPEEYREFLLNVGNGGGPYWGVNSLSTRMGRYFLGYEDSWGGNSYPERLSKSFPLTDSLIIWKECSESASFAEWIYRGARNSRVNVERANKCEKRFDDAVYSHGTLELCHHGCGMFSFLVVCGAEYGNVWWDDRANSEGIFPLRRSETDPSRINFLEWYEIELDHSLLEIQEEKFLSGRHYHRLDEWLKNQTELLAFVPDINQNNQRDDDIPF